MGLESHFVMWLLKIAWLTVKPTFIAWYFVSFSSFALISVSIFAVTSSGIGQQFELSTNIPRGLVLKPGLNDLSPFLPIFWRVNDFQMTFCLRQSSKSLFWKTNFYADYDGTNSFWKLFDLDQINPILKFDTFFANISCNEILIKMSVNLSMGIVPQEIEKFKNF